MTVKKLALFPTEETELKGREARLKSLECSVSMCQKCELHSDSNTVFGVGNSNRPDIAFVGESPGAAEEARGEPFAGKCGELLDKMLGAMDYARSDVYLCNIVNCKTPGMRKPKEVEIKKCHGFVANQLHIVQPKIIIALGTTAAQVLANSQKGLNELRGRWMVWKDKKSDIKIPLRATYHPAYLLRNPNSKSEAWKDLQVVSGWLKD